METSSKMGFAKVQIYLRPIFANIVPLGGRHVVLCPSSPDMLGTNFPVVVRTGGIVQSTRYYRNWNIFTHFIRFTG